MHPSLSELGGGRREEQRGESLHVRCGVSGGGGGEKCVFESVNTRDRVECVQSGSPQKLSGQHSVWIAGCLEGTLLVSSVNMNNRVVENDFCFSALRARASEERRTVAIKTGGRCCALPLQRLLFPPAPVRGTIVYTPS